MENASTGSQQVQDIRPSILFPQQAQDRTSVKVPKAEARWSIMYWPPIRFLRVCNQYKSQHPHFASGLICPTTIFLRLPVRRAFTAVRLTNKGSASIGFRSRIAEPV